MEHVKENATTNDATHTASRSRYVGPSAARIAELIAPRQRVRFERGWFWTAAFCHGTEQEQDLDQMAFRQRPDGDGIDVRCQSAGCSRERIIRSLEQLTRETIWSAYTAEARTSTPAQASAPASVGADDERSWRVAPAPFMAVMVLLLAAPLVFGYDLQVVALNAVGLGWSGWLARRVLLAHRHAAAKGGRQR